MNRDVTTTRLGLFRWEAKVQVVPHVFEIMHARTKRKAIKRLRLSCGEKFFALADELASRRGR